MNQSPLGDAGPVYVVAMLVLIFFLIVLAVPQMFGGT